MAGVESNRVVVIGSGFGGLAAAIRLKQLAAEVRGGPAKPAAAEARIWSGSGSMNSDTRAPTVRRRAVASAIRVCPLMTSRPPSVVTSSRRSRGTTPARRRTAAGSWA